MLLAAGVATSAGAVTYTMSNYSVTAYTGNNGLDIETQHDANTPMTFILNGNNASFGPIDLFDIWTNEDWVDYNDTTPRQISVDFTFSAPSADGGTVYGETYGVSGNVQNGRVIWNGPLALNFGGETLTVSLGNATFDVGDDEWGDEGNRADVTATFTQTINAGVPEPASWALMIGGFGMAGAMLRRRRSGVAATA
jgi:hypothetical protein